MIDIRSKGIQGADESQIAAEGVAFGLAVSVVAEFILGKPGVSTTDSPLGNVPLSTIALCSFYVFTALIPTFRRKPKDLLALIAVTISQLFLLVVGEAVASSLSSASSNWSLLRGVSDSSLFFGLPLASGPLLLQLVLGVRYSLICALSIGYLTHLYLPDERVLLVYVLATSLVGCLSLKRVRSRSSYTRAGFFIFLSALAVVTSANLDTSGFSRSEGSELLVQVLSAFAGAVFTSLITSGFSPLLEMLGGYVTDMRLLEMATLDHPLLKELSIQAPGTWNHSMVMGMMGEAAADAIGANPVLAKVGSYFHDIGKSKKPLYFVENQFGGENRHDRLSPSMSALIIRSHVKDGLEMAKKYHLPEVILDMISQHHGTSTIEFFYDKALKDAEHAENGGEVERSHYQYPGPKPQTREAGILMLADGIEAASRTMADPSFDRIQGMVQKMINKVFSSGQLEECELTLLDLHHIARCFTRVLAGIHHHRIAYSEPVEKVRAPRDNNEDSSKGERDTSIKIEVPSNERKEGEELKRLGLQNGSSN
jgi:hypothetical protein